MISSRWKILTNSQKKWDGMVLMKGGYNQQNEKTTYIMWEDNSNHTHYKGLMSKICKELLQFNSKKLMSQLKMG